MPELPEVETTVRGLARYLDGARLARVELRRADLRRPFPVDLVQVLTGATVTGMGRRAKYGLVHTDRGQTMVFHLGMSGRWRIEPEELGPHDHMVLETASGHVLALCDPRRFGSVDLVATDSLEQWPQFAAMGPEPLGEALTARHLKTALAGRSAAIKLMLLDQRIVAGLGNIYVCEALHRAGISPLTAGGKLVTAAGRPGAALARLPDAIRDVLDAALAAGGSSLRDHRQADGSLGYFQHSFRVYDREGAACPTPGCAGTIARTVQSGRSTFHCPRCQK